MIVVRTSGNNKFMKLVYASLAFLFALTVVFCIMAYTYTFMAFPIDVNEEQCGILTNEATKIILCKRSGNATIAFHYVLYENEIKPDNVVAIIKDTGTIPTLEYGDKGYVMARISDVNDIVYLVKNALVCDLHQRGALIKMKVK